MSDGLRIRPESLLNPPDYESDGFHQPNRRLAPL